MVCPVKSVWCRPAPAYARSCYGVPLWWGRIRLPAYSWCAPLPTPASGAGPAGAVCPDRAVAPAAYVELRALDVERNEQRAARRAGEAGDSTAVETRRLWPYRWAPAGLEKPSAGASNPSAARVTSAAPPARGQYIDIVI